MKYLVITEHSYQDYDGDEIETFTNLNKARKFAKDKINDVVPFYRNFVTIRLFKEVRI